MKTELIWNDDTLIPAARLLTKMNPALAGFTVEQVAQKIKNETTKAIGNASQVTAFHSFTGFVATWYEIGNSTIVNFFVFPNRVEAYIATLKGGKE